MIKRNFKKLATPARKGFLVAAIATLTVAGAITNARAEGYQINAQSAKQLGMGHTGVALKLGAESMLFNPAGMSFMENKFDLSLGITGVSSKVTYTNGAYSAKTDNPLGTPLFGYIGYKPSKNLAIGISITNPVGNSLKWPAGWNGSTLIQEINLKGFCIQPTVSYKFGNFISLGAGLMIDYGNFDLSRALIPVNGLDAGLVNPTLKPMIESFAGQVPLSAKLNGKAKINVGVNVGVLINVSEKVSIGASYRSQINFNVKDGDAELNYANDNVKTVINALNSVLPVDKKIVIPPLNEGSFEASLPAPSNINAGIGYKPCKDLTLTAELQFVGWKAYDSLTIQFDERIKNYSIKAEKNYKNAIIYRIGAEYKICQLATVRLGAYYDTTPVRSDLYNPETPGSNKIAITAGASIRPVKFMSIDIALAYLNGAKTHGSYPIYATNNPSQVVGHFEGDYKASAFMPSIGLSFHF